MNFAPVEDIADAVLYEGYILYPYRASSIKNQQRWNFGTLFPRDFAEAQNPNESWSFHTEVLLKAEPETRIDARVRFLQLVPANIEAEHGWDEGFARSRTIESVNLTELSIGLERRFDLSSLTEEEVKRAPSSFGSCSCSGALLLHAVAVAEGLFRLTAEFRNETPISNPQETSRRNAQGVAFTSAHLLLHASKGSFVSAFDPEPQLVAASKACVNLGVFPVLAGEPGRCNLMLCSPIILYDYPQIAPESTGDFFDGTEMDEMLALRVMTLTETEQEEMRRVDPHGRAILERIETLPKEHLLKVHGAVRGMKPVDPVESEEIHGAIEPWNPFEERPLVESVRIFGVELRKGDRVRLWPQKKADIMDMVLDGKFAVVEAIEQDLEDNIQLAVVLDDDPGRDLGLLRQAGHRFFFSPEEIEPLGAETL
jgi:hypothetical protein